MPQENKETNNKLSSLKTKHKICFSFYRQTIMVGYGKGSEILITQQRGKEVTMVGLEKNGFLLTKSC
jgi:hypothetical protein